MIKNKININNQYGQDIGQVNPFLPKWIQETLNDNYLMYTDIIIHYILDLKCVRITEAIENQVITYKHKDWDSFTKEEQFKMLDEATDEGMENIFKEIELLF